MHVFNSCFPFRHLHFYKLWLLSNVKFFDLKEQINYFEQIRAKNIIV